MPKHTRNPVPKRRNDVLRPKLIAASVAACFAVSAAQSHANPTGATVVSGSASFNSAANALTVTNSANAIINWQGFSIGVNEITRFVQPSSASAVLNRVTGAGGVIPQSVIDGVLSSNGRVFLLNPSGIVIGASAQIDVAGLVASSLNLSNEDFLNNRLRFTDVPGAGAVVNNGVIQTASGGRVYLVAPSVENNGLIRSPQGEIVLAAGKEVELVSEASPFVTVRVTADAEQAVNLGEMIAEAGRIGMFGALVRQGGVAQANSAVVGENGQIRLVATRDLTLEAGSTTTANGPSGGSVLLQAEGGTNLVAGTVEATGSEGKGGQVQALGLRVGVIGSGVIDASGETGGGTVLVGGDYQGANPGVQNAERTLIGADGVIRADARSAGDGGRVIVWADEDTRFFGSISARGGAQSGNGGFVETSAPSLTVAGQVDTRAPNGAAGTWLLDPFDINIVPGLTATIPGGIVGFDDPPTTGATGIGVATIDQALSINGTVTIQAHNNIALQTNLTLANTGNFIAQAGNNINLGAFNISIHGNLVLSANDPQTTLPGPSGVGSITSNAGFGNITTDGGSATLSGVSVTVGNVDTTSATTAAGSISITSTETGVAANGIRTGSLIARGIAARSDGGDVTLTSNAGNITVNGSIDTRGADGAAGFSDGSSGGNVTMNRDASTVLGTVSVNGNINTSGGNALGSTTGAGGSGGLGGSVYIGTSAQGSMFGDALVTGSIDTHGGNASDATTGGLGGGDGGFGGGVTFRASGNVTVSGAAGIDTRGGAGGAGASGSQTDTQIDLNAFAEAGAGGFAGSGGGVELTAGGNVSSTGIVTSGGAGGAGAANATANASASSTFANVQADAIAGVGAFGGSAGGVNVTASSGAITMGTITAIGGAGGAGGANAIATSVSSEGSASAEAGSGGGGGQGGFISLNAGTTITTGAISSSGGTGGVAGNGASASADGSSVYGNFVFSQASAGNGGSGGWGGDVNMTAGGVITTGTITSLGALGGAAGSGASASAVATTTGTAFAFVDSGHGGSGGYGGGVNLSGSNAVRTGDIFTNGGAGSAGGAGAIATGSAAATIQRGAGGDGGEGGFVDINSNGGQVIVTGTIDASGARGGDGGAGGGSGGRGGDSGNTVSLLGSSVSVSGPIFARGSGGGVGADGSLNRAGGQGGSGGFGAAVTIALDFSQAAANTVNVAAIDTSGGSGGSGGSDAGAGAGAGGGGGSAGSVYVNGSTVSYTSVGASGGNAGDAGTGDLLLAVVGGGGFGGSVTIQNAISAGNITANGGRGGNADANGAAGSGGGGGSAIVIGSGGTAGAISVNGGAGGNAGLTSTAADGGTGGFVSLSGFGTLGPISATGGNAGTGGALVAYGGGAATVYGSSAGALALAGPITVRGGLNSDGTPATGTGSLALTAAGSITQAAGAPIVLDGSLDVTTTAGDVALGNAGNRIPILVAATAPGNIGVVNGAAGTLMQVQSASAANLSFVSDQVIFSGAVNGTTSVEYYTASDLAISVTPTFFTNITTPLMKIGRGTMTSDISLVGPINLTAITNLSLITSGTIFQPTTTESLTVTGLNADGGTVSLLGANNSVTNLQGQARTTGTGFFEFVNLGAINLATVDPGNAVGGVSSAGLATLSAGGNITSSVGAGYAVQGTSVTLASGTGALGSAAAPLQVRASSLDATGVTGVYVNTNAFSPAPVTVTQLQNSTSGDIQLNAWGGAQITTTVFNPNGNVFIYSHSPLDVLAGITAGQNIELATQGTSANDMLLDGTFSYGTGSDFKVTVGPFGALSFGATYNGTITILAFASGDPFTVPEVTQSVGTVTAGTERAVEAGSVIDGTTDEDEKKREERKGATVCK